LPTVADGFLLKTWRSGPQAGQPKVPLPAEGLIERGLMRIDSTQHWPRLLFTESGLVALRRMMTDRRLADPERYSHIRQELARGCCRHAAPRKVMIAIGNGGGSWRFPHPDHDRWSASASMSRASRS
jgi:hypothetical protein